MIRAQAGKLCHCLRDGKLHLRRVCPVADDDRTKVLRTDRPEFHCLLCPAAGRDYGRFSGVVRRQLPLGRAAVGQQHLHLSGAVDLLQELRDSLDEYYKVSSLENYDEVFKAVAFFTYKYGKIDWLESNNEYWLMRDAALRTEFNITTGPKLDEMDKIKFKSCMKKYYAKAGIPTARYHLVEGLEDALEFAHTVGYPVVVKPDSGVGSRA